MLFSTILGAITGLVPGIIKFFELREQNAHQIEVLKLQMQSNKQNAELQISVSNAQADIQQQQSLYAFDAAASGIRWIDGLRSSVRPLITYVFFAVWLAIEVLLLSYGLQNSYDLLQLAKVVWSEDTAAMFGAIVGFWFGNRALEKYGYGQTPTIPPAKPLPKGKK